LLLLSAVAPGRGDLSVAVELGRAYVGEVRALLPAPWWTDRALTAAFKATAGGEGWRIWQALVKRCLIDGTAGSGDPGERLASLGRAVAGHPAVSIESLHAWAGPAPGPGQ
jgi:hypothetical protein